MRKKKKTLKGEIINNKKRKRNRPTIGPGNTTPRDIPEGMRFKLQQRHLDAHDFCSTIQNSQTVETVKMPHY
jgi:hypothetical protein